MEICETEKKAASFRIGGQLLNPRVLSFRRYVALNYSERRSKQSVIVGLVHQLRLSIKATTSPSELVSSFRIDCLFFPKRLDGFLVFVLIDDEDATARIVYSVRPRVVNRNR